MLTPSATAWVHHALHRDRVAGVEPAGDARRANDLEQPGVVADVVCAKTLAHIGVEIDCLGHMPSFGAHAVQLRLQGKR